ncbi:TPA: hypothetical protein N0F65_007815 [Lagenidium giganteum]|uniref:1,3-beta-glucan synthase n=1 Tax=Lagenidium giganteum TaxID=4803 RepID=A0AAV2Z3H8_9STRA|nr:TPA: hypothetical protein N0F65_007815 [Lagenidium giganteum]
MRQGTAAATTKATAASFVETPGSFYQQGSMSRRRVASNYVAVDEHAAARRAPASSASSTLTAPPQFPLGDDVFKLLQAKFGFQEGSVRNQKEHFDCWVLNAESRVAGESDAVQQIHNKFFKNYHRWCEFLQTPPVDASTTATAGSLEAAAREVALFLLIWGESGNLRFMPECLCFLYHCMASKLDGIESLPDVPEGSFLRRVVRPLYQVVARMRAEPAGGARPLDHKNVTNYDDVNEFFWSPRCLDFDEFNAAEAINLQEHKTFKERRSIFNPLLAFFRIYFFLAVSFHVLVAIGYVSYRTDPKLHTGFHFYSNFFSPDHADIRKQAFYSVFITVSALLSLKVVLEVWIGGLHAFTDTIYACGLFFRLVWHSVFFGIFSVVNASPYEKLLGKQDMLSMGLVFIAVYLAPVIVASFLRMCCGSLVWSNAILSSLNGTRHQFIGRHMGQSWGSFFKYGCFWSIIFACKLMFSMQLMVKPLIGPSVEIYSIEPTGRQLKNGVIESHHNLLFLVAMWAPVILVYIYDCQIWLAILQSIVGTFNGLRLKIGHSSRLPEFISRLKSAPQLFDQKVVSNAARSKVPLDKSQRHLSAIPTSPEATTQLRFATVWNEVVSSFRLSDLLDDREAAILQYQISVDNAVEDPVFLLAGQAQIALDIVMKAKQRGLDDQRLKKELAEAGVLVSANHCVTLCFRLLRQLLGQEDAGIVAILQKLIDEGRLVGTINVDVVATVKDNIVEVLASLLDLPEPDDGSVESLPSDQVTLFVQRVDALLKSLELLLTDETMAKKLRDSVFTRITPDMRHQKQQILRMFATQDVERKDSSSSNEDAISMSTRLFFLLTLDAADSLPRCYEAQRRMSFFLNSLAMDMPQIESIASMHSFSVITPYYNEPVLYSIDELNGRVNSNPLFAEVEQKGRDLSILKYLITFHGDEWSNFLERVEVSTMEEALTKTPTQVRLWASMRGQTLARTVHGMMMYEDALKMLRWLEVGSDDAISHIDKIKHMDRIAGLKFTYVTSCQIYSQQLAAGDPRAADIDLMMHKYPNWRVSYVDAIPAATSNEEPRYDCVLVKSDGDEIVEVYRYELPGNPLVGEGKPENQNVALAFTRGEYVQTIDMNQEHYFEEALKIPNFLATGTAKNRNIAIIGMKEHIFTGRASSLAHFMTLQELVFVSLTQRVLANPLCSRMHYGHPDVFEKSFVMTNGGVSKASKGINLSEDVFSGYNAALRGEHVTHEEFMQCGKGRDVTLSQINAFEAKLSNGSAESSLSRDAHRMGAGMDFFRLNSMFYGHMGFYICNALTVLCVFVYAYAKLYIALHEEVQNATIVKTKSLDDLADVLNTQFIFQFGMLMTIPLMATLLVEYGWRQAFVQFVELLVTLGPVFYIFETGTKAHFFDVAIMRGGSKYRGTGRGFAIIRETLVNFFKEYAASHYRKAVELLGLMILFGVFGNFKIGTGALHQYCREMGYNMTVCDQMTVDDIPQNVTLLQAYGSKGQDYGVASFAVWLLAACWLFAPFFFNTDGMDFAKTRVDVTNWLRWMMALPESAEASLPNQGTPSDSWLEFFHYETGLCKDMRWTARVGYAIRELRHPMAMYYVFTFKFDLANFALLGGCVGGVALLLWIGSMAGGACMKHRLQAERAVFYMIFVVGGIFAGPLILGAAQGWTFLKSLSLMFSIFIGLYSILQYLLILNGIMGLPVAKWGLAVELAFLFDMVVGFFLVVPLLVCSALPFMRTIQTRMMYNGGFSRALSSGNEYAASISVMVGLCGGFAYGWLTCLVYSLGYVNDLSDHFINESFKFYVDKNIKGFNLESWKVFAALAAAIGSIVGVSLAHFLGRRIGTIIPCFVVFGGVGVIFMKSSAMVLLGCCLVAAGIAMVSISCMLYNFETCTVGWKGKGVLMFLVGASFGYFIEALVLDDINATAIEKDWTNNPTHDWQYQFIYGSIPLVPLVLMMVWLPESPVWLCRHRGAKATEATLVRLRQKHDVTEEMDELQSAQVPKGNKINIGFRVALVLCSQTAFAMLMSNALLLRVKVQPSRKDPGEQTSKWMIYFGLINFIGVLLSLMSVDNVRRKTIFKDILPLVGVLAIACGVFGSLGWGKKAVTSIALLMLYASAALSLTCATWLTAIEVFPSYQHSRWVGLVFFWFYGVQAIVYVAKLPFVLSHLVFAGLCLLLTFAMFSFCASTKDGAIQLKSEKQAAKDNLLREMGASSSFAARSSRSQSFLRSRVSRQSSNYQAQAL